MAARSSRQVVCGETSSCPHGDITWFLSWRWTITFNKRYQRGPVWEHVTALAVWIWEYSTEMLACTRAAPWATYLQTAKTKTLQSRYIKRENVSSDVVATVPRGVVPRRTEDADSAVQLRTFRLEQSGVRRGEARRVSDLLHEPALPAQRWA